LALPPEKILVVKADVTSEPEVVDLFRRIQEKFTRLDVVVNNAGFAWPGGGPADLELADAPA
jgi:NAD(P)-dependent dehydrogenase (short-subunit alcohol dehydrogenase family)